MRHPRLLTLALLTIGLALGTAGGCTGDVPDGTRVVRPEAARRSAGLDPAAGAEARGRFHARNRLDWVGVAHNAAMRDFGARVASGHVRGNVCDEILSMVARAAYLPAGARLSGQVLRSQASRVLSADGSCRAPEVGLHPAAFGQSEDNLSPEATALVTEIRDAAAVAPSSGDLAVMLLPILERASQLAAVEAEIVMAGASVAQSSMEHWESTLTDAFVSSQTDGILSSYGTCFTGYGTAEEGVSACMGLRPPSPLQPTTDRLQRHGAPAVRFVAAYAGCPRPNHNQVVKEDVRGAIAGAIASAWTGAGVLAGALGGGIGISTAEMMWQLGVGAWCHGSGAFYGTRPQPT